ncbi:hypothetical protein [Enterococcus sp. DIV0660C]|uniref:hypothetical protein n=1 Tax=Enterococcus sp. DIV0660C TaxID=2230880 RepID=UPI001A8D85CD|nr:hypothetical protein [Enterococcus sp. DIV0660C]MBO0432501.1 hypothetical protein [Enterococcus sp. DIV0660C]
MEYKIEVTSAIQKMFPEHQSKSYQELIMYKVNEHLTHDFYRIKSVRLSVKQPVYEMKIHLGKEYFRIAFRIDDKRVQVFYISRTLQKEVFDKEVNKLVIRFSKDLWLSSQ